MPFFGSFPEIYLNIPFIWWLVIIKASKVHGSSNHYLFYFELQFVYILNFLIPLYQLNP